MRVLVALFSIFGCFANERVYLEPKELSFREEGIFLKVEGCDIPLSSISYDYCAQKFYIFADNRVTLIWCSYCGNQTYWVEERCCLSRGYDCIWECKRRK